MQDLPSPIRLVGWIRALGVATRMPVGVPIGAFGILLALGFVANFLPFYLIDSHCSQSTLASGGSDMEAVDFCFKALWWVAALAAGPLFLIDVVILAALAVALAHFVHRRHAGRLRREIKGRLKLLHDPSVTERRLDDVRLAWAPVLSFDGASAQHVLATMAAFILIILLTVAAAALAAFTVFGLVLIFTIDGSGTAAPTAFTAVLFVLVAISAFHGWRAVPPALARAREDWMAAVEGAKRNERRALGLAGPEAVGAPGPAPSPTFAPYR